MEWNRRSKNEKGPLLEKIKISSKITKINYNKGLEVQDSNHLEARSFRFHHGIFVKCRNSTFCRVI